MKILYAARLARFDLLRAVSFLATKVTKWDAGCDKALHRLICDINSTLDYRLKGYIGDKMDDLRLSLYSDADFASCKETSRSTSGLFLSLEGPNSFFPLNAQSKKQTCVSHSTPESEIVAADAAVRIMGLPALDLWDVALGRRVKLDFYEDNQATLIVIKTGRNPTMRHLGRTHRVDLSFLVETFKNNSDLTIKYCVTSEQCADILTKAFTNAPRWLHACELIGVVPKLSSGGYGPDKSLRDA